MTYDRVKKSSWTPPAKTTSSFFPQTHIQTKKETKPSWEVTGVHTSKEAMERIRRSMFGSVEPLVEAPKETAPQETQQVQNPTPVSEEAVSGEIQAQPETGFSQSLGNGVSSQQTREGIQGRMFAQGEQTPVQKQEGTSPPTPLLQGEGSHEKAGGEERGKAETEISLPIQAKLTIGEPNDKYEQEADRVARQVVDKIHSPTPETVQRQEMGDEDEVRLKSEAGSGGKGEAGVGVTGVRKSPIEGVRVNRKVNSAGETQEASAQLEASIQGKRGSGQPLDESVKEPMEREFGADFSGVRVHTDGKADELNQAIQAYAFTTGEDIFFREGAYEPGSKGGQELLAHELTHVVQQSGGAVQRAPLPHEADVKGTKVLQMRGSENSGLEYSMHPGLAPDAQPMQQTTEFRYTDTAQQKMEITSVGAESGITSTGDWDGQTNSRQDTGQSNVKISKQPNHQIIQCIRFRQNQDKQVMQWIIDNGLWNNPPFQGLCQRWLQNNNTLDDNDAEAITMLFLTMVPIYRDFVQKDLAIRYLYGFYGGGVVRPATVSEFTNKYKIFYHLFQRAFNAQDPNSLNTTHIGMNRLLSPLGNQPQNLAVIGNPAVVTDDERIRRIYDAAAIGSLRFPSQSSAVSHLVKHGAMYNHYRKITGHENPQDLGLMIDDYVKDANYAVKVGNEDQTSRDITLGRYIYKFQTEFETAMVSCDAQGTNAFIATYFWHEPDLYVNDLVPAAAGQNPNL